MFPFSCPYCGGPLVPDGGSFRCENRHTFDRARSGYLNLLDVSRRRSRLPGDNPQMVAARRSFLERGHYAFLSNALMNTCADLLEGIPAPVILDAGCGEGYYTARLYDGLTERGFAPAVGGVDISKYAVDLAARRHKKASFAVASVFRLPVPDGACHAALNLFAPFCGEELARVLRPGGVLLMAIPGRDHLRELKEVLYDAPRLNEVRDCELDGFSFFGARKLSRTILLSSAEEILELFEMTPYAYRTSPEDQEKLNGLGRLTVTAAFELLSYRKDG